MADNIKIVGNVVSTSNTTRYSREDTNLISSTNIKENFGEPGDYIEYYIYGSNGNIINSDPSYFSYKLPTDITQTPGVNTLPNTTGTIQTDDIGIISTLTTSSALYPIIEIDPIKDIQSYGYSSGQFRTVYNLFQNKISDSNTRALFIQEISKDRTEIRLKSTTLQDFDIENIVTELINELEGSTYQIYYLLNFGNNEQYVAVNIALNKAIDGYEVLFKLYEPLPLSVQLKSTLWVVSEKVVPYNFQINLDTIVTPPPPPSLRGPNFDIEIPNNGTVSTEYNTYSNLISSVQALQQTSYHQILNLMATQSVDINIDYTDFNNFVFFGSAYQRISNFYNKAKQIEDYNTLINTYTPLSSSKPSLITEINQYSSAINTLITQFDGYEYYLYFESSSYAWPKSSSTKPYSLLSTSSLTVQNWYTATTSSAQNYDYNNYDNLEYAIPVYLKDDTNNAPFLLFLNMVGHYFDNTWIYLKSITDINRANNNLEEGISKDLVYERLKSLGVHLYNTQAGENVNQYLIGANTGSSEWDNNTTITGSYLNNIPRKDLVSELYKRIYHNLPLLVKTKGTVSGLEHLVTTFGISGSILNVKEYGGANKSEQLKGYNTSKVRIVNNTISGSVLSHELSLQPPYQSTTDFRDEDTHYVDISFSPQNQIDTYISGAIASNASTWSLDDYIGDPRQQYSSSYIDLDAQRKLYFETGVPGFAPFTGSNMDYNGFIRLIQYFDNSLFKMLEDFTPERTSLSTGVTFNSPVLERNKVVYANPSNSTTQSVPNGEVSASTISPQYGPLYNNLQGDKKPYFDGNLSGSIVDVNQYFTDNYNPYLGDWSVYNAQHNPTQSINTNTFAHSDWNVLLNNVSSSILSNIRKKIEYTGNYLPTGSLTSSAELQDSYLTLRSYNTSRYEGSKLTSKLYNTYTSGSYTGSDGRTIQTGDNSYGKTAAIDRQSYKVGWVKNIPSQSLNFYDKTQIQLKYLVDKDLNITDLTLKNNNLIEVQNIFKSGENVVLSLSDATKPSFQKTLDGTKTIFRGGYSYDPILFRENNEVLNFLSLTPRSSTNTFSGLKSYALDFFTGANSGDSIFNNQSPANNSISHNTPTTPADLPANYNTFGWSWSKNYNGWWGNGTLETTSPMASTKLSLTQFSSTYQNTLQLKNKTKYSPSPYAFTPNVVIQWADFKPQDSTAKFAYFFDLLKFNNTSYKDGYLNEDIDITDGGQYLYKAPRPSSQYFIKANIPVSIGLEFFQRLSTQYPNDNWLYLHQSKGCTFKIFGLLEGSITPTDPNSWTYKASTKISTIGEISVGMTYNSDFNTIHFDPTNFSNGSFDNQIDTPLLKGIAILQLTDDTTGAVGTTISLAQNEVLRFRIVLMDMDRFFTYGRGCKFEIGKPQQPPSTQTFIESALKFNVNNSLKYIEPSYIEIQDKAAPKILYNYNLAITGSKIFESFTTTENTITFSPEMQTIFSTSSLFTPDITTPTQNYYSPVIDTLPLQPYDLIRIGSISSPNPDYYTVISSSIDSSITVKNIPTVTIGTFQVSTSPSRFASILQIPVSTQNTLLFNNIWSSTSKQFIVNINGVNNPLTIASSPLIKTVAVNGADGIQYPSVLQIQVSPNQTIQSHIPTVPTIGSWGYTVLPTVRAGDRYILSYSNAVLTNYTYALGIFRTTAYLDKPLSTLFSSQLSQNFSILRPKPDETSIIINFKKSIGDVSQTILIPQDANNAIKASIGTIFQQLNVDLSNQNNITQ